MCPDCQATHVATFLRELASVESRWREAQEDARPIVDVKAELALTTHRYRELIETLGLDATTTSHAEVISVLKLVVESL